jgi:hypothetical protein
MSRERDLAMLKKTFIIALSLLLVVLSSGCFGGSPPPTLKESLTDLDAAVIKYNNIMGLYTVGNYTAAKEAYIAVAATFRDCESSLETAANGNVTTLEKRDANNLAGCCRQFAAAAQYMRDACTESLKPGENNAYLMKVSADECALTARLNYEANKRELEMCWSSQH